MDNLTQILEAILFASGSSRKKADIMALLPDVKKAQFDKSIEELKTFLEVLAIIAYKQPITRIEIEKIKATSADYAIGLLLKVNLIEVVGRKDAVGRPVLYGTTDEFLKKFQLSEISELPDYQAVLERLEELGVFNKSQTQLYRDIEINDDQINNNYDDSQEKERLEKLKNIEKALDEASIIDEMLNGIEEMPDFLDGEQFEVIE